MSIGLEHGCFVTHQGQLYCVGDPQRMFLEKNTFLGSIAGWGATTSCDWGIVSFEDQKYLNAIKASLRSVEINGANVVFHLPSQGPRGGFWEVDPAKAPCFSQRL